jgi:hypothetical protein
VGGSHWAEHTAAWARIGPPLRPDADVVAAMAHLLADHRGPTALLGVTQELADIADDVTAVDHDPGVVANVWPGDTADRRAVVEDWRRLSGLGRRFVAAVGDGSINSMDHPGGQQALHEQLERCFPAGGGRLVVRVFATPERPESLDDVRREALAGRIATFHACKWRIAMAVVAAQGDPDVGVEAIVDAFDDLFADRGALAEATGWAPEAIATIDVYRGSAEVYSFPTERPVLAAVPAGWSARFVAAGSYELAERCPLLVADWAGVPRP